MPGGAGIISGSTLSGLGDLGVIVTLLLIAISIINGLTLIWKFYRDRPILRASQKNKAQWFQIKDNCYGFLVRLKVSNKGLRDVSVDSCTLRIEGTKESLRFKTGHIRCGDGDIIIDPKLRMNPIVEAGTSIQAYALFLYEGTAPREYESYVHGHLAIEDAYDEDEDDDMGIGDRTRRWLGRHFIPTRKNIRVLFVRATPAEVRERIRQYYVDTNELEKYNALYNQR